MRTPSERTAQLAAHARITLPHIPVQNGAQAAPPSSRPMRMLKWGCRFSSRSRSLLGPASRAPRLDNMQQMA